jgi:CIC family chloride channel protein
MLLESYLPGYTSPIFYTMLGMGAMMSAALNAPLAALATLLELTANPEIIMPGMLILVTATLTSRRLFATPSVFVELMRAQGLQYANDPIAQLLRRLSVARCMERKILELPRRIRRRDLEQRLSNPPAWLLIADAEPRRHILFTADVFRHLEDDTEANELDLEAIPAHRLETVAISVQSTLWGALQRMDRERVDALYVTLPLKGETIGVITRQDIERSYQYTPG